MQIPILSGIYADSTAQVRTAYAVPTKSGISNGAAHPLR
jgi:hypothetical protein